jgi:hypothetical protein
MLEHKERLMKTTEGTLKASAPALDAIGNVDEVSAMTSDRTILITGVTGNQGGAVAQACRAAGSVCAA